MTLLTVPARNLIIKSLLVFAITAPQILNAAPGGNMLKNPSLKGGKGEIGNWGSLDKKHGKYSVTQNKEGGFIVETTPSSMIYLAFSQNDLGLKEGKHYKISFQVRAEPIEPFKFAVAVSQSVVDDSKKGSANNDRHIYIRKKITPSADWSDVSYVFTATPIETGSGWTTPRVALQCGSVNGKLFIKNLVLVETEEAPTVRSRKNRKEKRKRKQK